MNKLNKKLFKICKKNKKCTTSSWIGISLTFKLIVGDKGLSTTETFGLKGFDETFPGCGVFGISTMGLGLRVGIKSECPVDRKIPFRTGHGAWWLDIFNNGSFFFVTSLTKNYVNHITKQT